jgi:hypothetical protein
LGAFFLVLSLFPFAADAQVRTRVRIIEASNVGQRVDPSLKDIHSQLGSLFSFTSYRLLKDVNLILNANRPEMIPAHPGRYVEVTLVGEHRKTAELRLKIFREGTTILDTQVRLASGRTVLVGGPKHGEGVAILAISARF